MSARKIGAAAGEFFGRAIIDKKSGIYYNI